MRHLLPYEIQENKILGNEKNIKKKKLEKFLKISKLCNLAEKIIINEISVCVILINERLECESGCWEKDSQLSQKRLH